MKVFTLFLLASALLATGCREPRRASAFGPEWEKRTRAMLDDYEREAKRVDEMQAKTEELNRRYEKVLTKWEEQTRRWDAVLEAMEKQQGVKK